VPSATEDGFISVPAFSVPKALMAPFAGFFSLSRLAQDMQTAVRHVRSV